MTPRDMLTAAIAIALLATTSSRAQGEALKPDRQRFESAGKYILEINGEAITGARIYLSLSAGSTLLVTAPEMPSPLLVQPQGQRLDRVRQTDLSASARDDGVVELAPDAEVETAGSYAIEGTSLAWSDGERRIRLFERPLLGLHNAAAVAAWDPEYARRARRYSPTRSTLEALRAATAFRSPPSGETARIRVYFGSWCPRCAQAVPRLMRLASELEGSGLSFEFFGMPREETDAPDSFWREARDAGMFSDDVEIVPLAVVYRGDRRIGRIATGWGNPERELEKILADESKG